MADTKPFVASDALASVPHGFFQTGDGAHQYGYGADGDLATIAATRASAANTILDGARIVMPHQVHSADVVTVTRLWDDTPEGRPVADALVTDRAGLAIGIVTADCGPVLFVDVKAGVIGAAHAGWRGAHGGILENTIAAMEALGAERSRIIAAIGPTIAQASYEVDHAFRAQFAAGGGKFFAPGRDGHWQFDLPAYIARRLDKAGVARVDDLGADTYTLDKDYYSFRRATHQGANNYGRQISLIAKNS